MLCTFAGNFCRPFEATHGQALVRAERRCMADLQSLSSGPHSAVTAQCANYTGFGCQNVFRSGWQCWCIAASTALHLATWPQIFSASHLNTCLQLRSSTTSVLVAPRTVRSTIGDHIFRATAASVWNSLPESVRSSPSLQVFRSRLKTKLFARSYSCSKSD